MDVIADAKGLSDKGKKLAEGRTQGEIDLSPNARTVLEKRYLKRDRDGQVIEAPEDMFRRVAENIASADKLYDKDAGVKRTAKEFYRVMTNLEFLPNSPTLRGAGRRLQQLSGCFVVPVGDSLEEIFDALKYSARIHKTGGGVGFSFSKIRPRGDLVASTGNVAGGPISFMKVFNSTAQEITQGGVRMGANMGILAVNHPDILEFITCKKDGRSMTNFNISVSVTDDFMRAVENDEEYDLINPRTGETVKRLRAKEVFDLIVQMAWDNGDPGMVFIDRINEDNPTPRLGKIESTNPCITGDSFVSTELGLMRMRDLVERYASGGLRVVTDNRVVGRGSMVMDGTTGLGYYTTSYGTGLAPISQATYSGMKETIKVITRSGFELEATPDHKVLTSKGWIRAGRLKPYHHRVLIQSGAGRFGGERKMPFEVTNVFRGRNGRTYRFNLPSQWSHELGLALGWLVGDGWLRSGDRNCRVGFSFGKDDYEALQTLKPIINSWYGEDIKEINRGNGCYHLSYHSKFFVEFFQRLGVKSVRAEDKIVPESIFTAPKDAVAGFLKGLFSSDGTVAKGVNDTNYIRLTSKSQKLLKGCQLLLLNLGIRSRIYDRSRAPRKTFSYVTVDGEHREYISDGICYELNIDRENIRLYLEKIGFIGDKSQDKISRLEGCNFYSESFEDEVVSVLPNGEKEVYDLTEPQTHSFIVNSIITHNCGEQPLLPYESCVARGTRIITDRGLERIEELLARQENESILVATQLNGQEENIVFRPATVVHTGTKPVYKVTLTNGQMLRLTGDHRVYTSEGWKHTEDLLPGKDKIIVQNGIAGEIRFDASPEEVKRHQLFGWFTGDGWFTERPTFGLTFGPEDRYAFDALIPIWYRFTATQNRVQVQRNFVRCVSTQTAQARARFIALGFRPAPGPRKRVPASIFTASKELQIAYLQGLFSSDGTVSGRKPQISLSSASLELLRDVQLLLLNLGIHGDIKYYPVRPRGRSQGQLKISGKSSIRFMDLIGFPLSPQKQEKAQERLTATQRWRNPRRAIPVASVSADSEEDVYDIYEPITHSFLAEGMVVHNCNLGSINLSKMVTDDGEIDWGKLEQTTRAAVHFLDNVIDMNEYVLPQIEEMTKGNRKIGLGVMGFADMLIKLGISYNSDEGVAMAEKVMEFVSKVADEKSVEIAEERGVFPNFEGSIYDTPGDLKVRNATRTTIAPTGTIGVIADCSSGIEPLFAIVHTRETLFNKDGATERLLIVNKLFEEVAKERGFYSEELMRRIAENGSCQGMPEVPGDVQRTFVTAHDISPEWHIKMQAAFQRHIQNAVSKTINLSNDTTVDDVKSAYMLAYKMGCKGITIYRYGSREEQVLKTGAPAEQAEAQVKPKVPRVRPDTTRGITTRVPTGCGNLFVTINEDERGLCEVFARMGRSGACAAAQTEATSRIISIALRAGVKIEAILDQLRGIRCPMLRWQDGGVILSCPDAIGVAIERYLKEKEGGEYEITKVQTTTRDIVGMCPECGNPMEFVEGCAVCRMCGFNRCG